MSLQTSPLSKRFVFPLPLFVTPNVTPYVTPIHFLTVQGVQTYAQKEHKKSRKSGLKYIPKRFIPFEFSLSSVTE